MQNYLVTYDLCGEEKDYSDLINAIKCYQNRHIQDSVWIVKSSDTRSGIIKSLSKFVECGDRLVVGEIDAITWTNLLEGTDDDFHRFWNA